MTITEFLEARIAEDESDALTDAAEMARSSVSIQFDGATQARFTPARVLAECTAKRAIVSRHGDWNAEFSSEDDASICETCHDYSQHAPADWPCPTIRALADVYADHPDYRQEWA